MPRGLFPLKTNLKFALANQLTLLALPRTSSPRLLLAFDCFPLYSVCCVINLKLGSFLGGARACGPLRDSNANGPKANWSACQQDECCFLAMLLILGKPAYTHVTNPAQKFSIQHLRQ